LTDADTAPAIPLGRGINDVQLLVLTQGRNLAGIGELGELYVRSPHLAHGYIGDSSLTAETFLPDPFGDKSGARFYRTGELGRYRPDGEVESAGRRDRRVNIRGFRVELAEIESALKQCPGVKDAAVIASDFGVEASPPGARLMAYWVPASAHPASTEEIRGFLSARLPEFMLPSHFFYLERLPLDPNGKTDYRSLPRPSRPTPPSDVSSAEPSTDLERLLSRIFAEVLGLSRVDLQQDFFRLGGHSLLAAQVLARVREALGVTVELRAFLKAPTVASLGAQIEALQRAEKPSSSVETEREEIEL
jgi:acyl carrier protein